MYRSPAKPGRGTEEKLDPNWIVGFTQGDGTFGLNYIKQSRMKLGYTCQPQFRITQHERDLIVLNRIIESMGCGTLVKPGEGRDRYTISVANLKDLTEIVIPLFKTHQIYGAKFYPCGIGFFRFLWRSLFDKNESAFNPGRFEEITRFSKRNEYRKKILKMKNANTMYLCSNLFTWQKRSSRGLTWVNLLLYYYMLGLPESKFIYILRFVLDKINKKILWFRLELYHLKRAYQQETFANEKGSSETLRDIVYDFYEYSLLMLQHKKKKLKNRL